MGHMDGDETTAMNFYCNDFHSPPSPSSDGGEEKGLSPSLELRGEGVFTLCDKEQEEKEDTRRKNTREWRRKEKKLNFFNLEKKKNTKNRLHLTFSNYYFDVFAIKNPLWIQVFVLLILLPGSQVRSEADPKTEGPRPLPLSSPSRDKLPANISSLTAGFSIPGTIGGSGAGNIYPPRPLTSTTPTPITLSPSQPPSSSSSSSSSSSGEAFLDDDYPFENNTSSNTTVPLGDTAFLKCTVRNLGEREVFWIRRRDMHIISVGKNVYSNDERFNILNIEGSDDWVLQIKYVQKRDNGTYECQVSTGKGGIVSYSVHVFVAVPEAFILGNGEYHIQEGSTINLVCIVEKSPKIPEFLFWFHNDRMINFDKNRNLRIQTETGSKTQSRLIIEDAQVSDSGNYTCHVSHAESPASTLVYISQGDKMAAIQPRKSSSTSTYYCYYFPLPLTYQLLTILLMF